MNKYNCINLENGCFDTEKAFLSIFSNFQIIASMYQDEIHYKLWINKLFDGKDIIKDNLLKNNMIGYICLALYTYLVVPVELKLPEHEKTFDEINSLLNKKLDKNCYKSTYRNDRNKQIDFCYHLRNAGAHLCVTEKSNKYTFHDQRIQGQNKEEFDLSLSLSDTLGLIHSIAQIILKTYMDSRMRQQILIDMFGGTKWMRKEQKDSLCSSNKDFKIACDKDIKPEK